MKYVAPSVEETAFSCPHCLAFAAQTWYMPYVVSYSGRSLVPELLDHEVKDKVDYSNVADPEGLRQWVDNMVSMEPFFDSSAGNRNVGLRLYNLDLSKCFSCSKVSVWIHNRLVYPSKGEVDPANPDMPDDIKRDYDEAGAILDRSPRGAAALLRLAIQKLCKELGQSGHNINGDIAALVAAGLDSRVQMALDAVRVIGNSAVHPGQIDLRDDRSTAQALFRLINLIVDKTISEPKHVQSVYDSLPQNLLKAIEERDKKK